MKVLCNLSAEELTLAATALAIDIAKDKTAEEIFALKNFFSQVCQSLSTLGGQRQFTDKCCPPRGDNMPRK